ncbi:MAG TPA: molybdopterin-dependent oxidoreductase [Thermodesulfobacteriota bacterium]|nr:molybdopterin-dependent oxidoreductase [Thermodesulfobacteriota bacterium]
MSDNVKKGAIKRRDFLKIIGVAGGTAAITGGCSPDPVEKIIPYVIPPDDVIPGVPTWYASTCTECPAGCGILVKNMDGRAIKIEGNPQNPINSGKTCAMGQAILQGHYNPDRIRSPLSRNSSGGFKAIGWNEAEKSLIQKVQQLKQQGRANRIVFLTNNVSGTLDKLIKEWLSALSGGSTAQQPGSGQQQGSGLATDGSTQPAQTGGDRITRGVKHIVYETFAHEPLQEANRITFGIDKIPTYHIDKAKYLLSFGADFLETWLSPTEYERKYSKAFTYEKGKEMGKFVQVEPRLSLTGANADEWVPVKPGTEGFLALGIANVIAGGGSNLSNYTPDRISQITGVPKETINRLAKEFMESKPSVAIGGGVAVTGTNATETLAAINMLNYVAGNVGDTIDFGRSLTLSKADSFRDIKSLVDSMNRGEVELLLIYNANPVFTLPNSLKFREALRKVPFVISFSSFMDETSQYANLILPDHSTLETWGDFIPKEGIHGLIQPAMRPIFNTKPTGDVILSVSKQIEGLKDQFNQKTYYDYLRDSWKEIHAKSGAGKDFETFWFEAVQRGGVFIEAQPTQVQPSGTAVNLSEPKFEGQGDMYFVAYPSYRYYDGRGANKPWLQELPDALTKAVWDSWVEIHPDTAKKLGIEEGDFVSIESPFGKIETQAFVYKGIRPDTVAVPIGLGHTSYGRYAENRGVNPIAILPSATDEKSGGFAWLSIKVNISKTGRSELFVKTQNTMDQGGREVARAVTLKELEGGAQHSNGTHSNGASSKEEGEHSKEPVHRYGMYKPHEHIKYRWGMAIDLSKCTGCGACVVACYAENNVAVVGKEQVARGRHMAWLRIDRYFEEGDKGRLDVRFQPMLCQHCDNAPCEPVCPVFATYHNHEGLNGMIYNRCVGTRYCSNNCSYKVRRFNWYTYKWPEPLNWQLNPDVTVRSKGVMEKCTYCVQRINSARRRAKNEGRDLEDGEVITACAQACPTDAIVFGSKMDPNSRVSRLSNNERGYGVLEDLNTKPSITYLKKVKRDEA